jgi:hypothetical protein
MYTIGQHFFYLYKQSGEEFTVDAEVVGVHNNQVEIEFDHPGGRTHQGGYRHRKILTLPKDAKRIVSQEMKQELPPKRGAPKGNKNAQLGKHASVLVRIPVGLTDALYECLNLDEENAQRIREYALDILQQHTREQLFLRGVRDAEA